MNTRDEIVMKEIADKTLSFGCIVKWWQSDCICIVTRVGENYLGILISGNTYKDIDKNPQEREYKVIGHPIQLHNILQWAENKKFDCYYDDGEIVIKFKEKYNYIPRDLSQDYLGQSEETKEAIFKLVNEVRGTKLS